MDPISPINFLTGANATPTLTQSPRSEAIGGRATSTAGFDNSGWSVQIGSGMNLAGGSPWMVAALAALVVGAAWYASK